MKYQIVIGENPEISEKVQKAVFAAGGEWRVDGRTLQHKKCLFLFWADEYLSFDNVPVRGYATIAPSKFLAKLEAGEIEGLDPLRGKSMEEWLLNEDKVQLKDVPGLVKKELFSRWKEVEHFSRSSRMWYDGDFVRHEHDSFRIPPQPTKEDKIMAEIAEMEKHLAELKAQVNEK